MGYRAGNSLWVERHTQTKLASGTATGNGSQSSVDTTSNAPPRSPPRSKLSPHRQHLTQLRPPLHTLLCVGVSAYSTCRRRFCLPVSLQSSLLAVSTQQIAPPAPVRGSRIERPATLRFHIDFIYATALCRTRCRQYSCPLARSLSCT
jgi:hypothetical protein